MNEEDEEEEEEEEDFEVMEDEAEDSKIKTDLYQYILRNLKKGEKNANFWSV